MHMSIFGRSKSTKNQNCLFFYRNEEDKEKGFKLLTGWSYRGHRIEVSVSRIYLLIQTILIHLSFSMLNQQLISCIDQSNLRKVKTSNSY
jgi:hypothetical protein